jgi:hypothetical protein
MNETFDELFARDPCFCPRRWEPVHLAKAKEKLLIVSIRVSQYF